MSYKLLFIYLSIILPSLLPDTLCAMEKGSKDNQPDGRDWPAILTKTRIGLKIGSNATLCLVSGFLLATWIYGLSTDQETKNLDLHTAVTPLLLSVLGIQYWGWGTYYGIRKLLNENPTITTYQVPQTAPEYTTSITQYPKIQSISSFDNLIKKFSNNSSSSSDISNEKADLSH